jgi:hypothetical protein
MREIIFSYVKYVDVSSLDNFQKTRNARMEMLNFQLVVNSMLYKTAYFPIKITIFR